MKVVLFGATGMLGSGTLIECLAHPEVTAVLTVGRRATGMEHEKLTELIHDDFLDFRPVTSRFAGFDACLFCLGVSSAGMSEEAYRMVTVDVAVSAAKALLEASSDMALCFVSGAGTDDTERGRTMWARVKGAAENRLAAMPFRAVWLFRPGYVQPVKGVRSRTTLYNAAYAAVGWLYPVLRRVAPRLVTNTENVGLALIRAARDGAPSKIIDNAGINDLAEAERRSLA